MVARKTWKYHKFVDMNVNNTTDSFTTTVNLQYNERSDIIWLLNNTLKVNEANKTSKGDKIIITSTFGYNMNHQTYIQYITLDGFKYK
jgi:hypothetical protein